MPMTTSAKNKLALMTIVSLPLAWAHWFVANTQLSSLGFAARNRDPNYLTFTIGYALALIALGNLIYAFMTRNFATSGVTLLLIVIALPALYLLSW